MNVWHLSSWTKVTWLSLTILLALSMDSAPAGDHAASTQGRDEISGVTVYIPIPLQAVTELYGRIYRDVASHRTAARDWITLGGGTGFLKYRIWPGEQGLKVVAGQLVSLANFPFGVEYAKSLNGTPAKVAECGQRDATDGTGRLSIQIATTFVAGRDYTVVPRSRIATVQTAGACLLSEERVDAAPLMAQVYQSDLHGILQAVDRKAASLGSLKPAVTRVWKELQEPILLDKERALWLLVNPEAVGAAGVGTLAENPAAVYGMTARPTVVQGEKHPQPLPLPDAQDRFQNDGFHVTFTLQVPIEEANERLREAVVGQEWSLGVGTIKIAGARLYPLGDRVGVELSLRGLLPLTLHLKGKPAYDESTGKISFQQVDYTIKERTTATDLAEEWLHEPLRQELARRLVLPIREELNLMRQALENGVNRDLKGGRLRGTVQQLTLKDLVVQTDRFSATFKTDGVLQYEARAESGLP